ncbi:hypothetical protein [Rhodococcoides yunnanense]|uniref:hypothetical protein n=1 Tax=Rhodococcoides yunnanense TaxID=278209 RepID=UPI0009323226|nr:hypothetical protein [Rhodococcus yunnanensis]
MTDVDLAAEDRSSLEPIPTDELAVRRVPSFAPSIVHRHGPGRLAVRIVGGGSSGVTQQSTSADTVAETAPTPPVRSIQSGAPAPASGRRFSP